MMIIDMLEYTSMLLPYLQLVNYIYFNNLTTNAKLLLNRPFVYSQHATNTMLSQDMPVVVSNILITDPDQTAIFIHAPSSQVPEYTLASSSHSSLCRSASLCNMPPVLFCWSACRPR